MLALGRDVIVTEVEGEAVVLDAAHGRYWQLNPSGAAMLADLLGGQADVDVAARMAAGTNAPAAQVLADLRALVGRLHDARLVVKKK
jgi:hypothetical protein